MRNFAPDGNFAEKRLFSAFYLHEIDKWAQSSAACRARRLRLFHPHKCAPHLSETPRNSPLFTYAAHIAASIALAARFCTLLRDALFSGQHPLPLDKSLNRRRFSPPHESRRFRQSKKSTLAWVLFCFLGSAMRNFAPDGNFAEKRLFSAFYLHEIDKWAQSSAACRARRLRLFHPHKCAPHLSETPRNSLLFTYAAHIAASIA